MTDNMKRTLVVEVNVQLGTCSPAARSSSLLATRRSWGITKTVNSSQETAYDSELHIST